VPGARRGGRLPAAAQHGRRDRRQAPCRARLSIRIHDKHDRRRRGSGRLLRSRTSDPCIADVVGRLSIICDRRFRLSSRRCTRVVWKTPGTRSFWKSRQKRLATREPTWRRTRNLFDRDTSAITMRCNWKPVAL